MLLLLYHNLYSDLLDVTDLCRLSQAHAKLMFREEVTVQDAVVTVALIESSMQSTALIGQVNVLHTSFPKDPVEEYARQGEKSTIISYSLVFFKFNNHFKLASWQICSRK